MSDSIKDFKIYLHTFTDTNQAIVVLGTGPMYQVFLFVGPSDDDGFVGFNRCEVHEDSLDGYIAGLFKIRKAGSLFQQVRSVTAGTVCGFELDTLLYLEIKGDKAQLIEMIKKPISRILFYSQLK